MESMQAGRVDALRMLGPLRAIPRAPQSTIEHQTQNMSCLLHIKQQSTSAANSVTADACLHSVVQDT
jgi:hypothetical protein